VVFIHPEYHIINAEAEASNISHTNASNYNSISQTIELWETAAMQETKIHRRWTSLSPVRLIMDPPEFRINYLLTSFQYVFAW